MNYKRVNWVEKIKGRFFNKVTMALCQNNFLTNLFHTTRHSERRCYARRHINFALSSTRHSERCEGATHVSMFDKNRRVAFTLAEVLITLGIIGVVAALTIPTLISNYNKRQTVTKLKQTYSILSQALTMAQVKEGDTSTWDIAGIYGTPTDDPNFNYAQTIKIFSSKYLIPYIKVSKDYGYKTLTGLNYDGIYMPVSNSIEGSSGSFGYIILLSNNVLIKNSIGTQCIEHNNDNTCQKREYRNIIFTVDINGFNSPNTMGKDVFLMHFDLTKKQFGFNHGTSNKSRNFYQSQCTTDDGSQLCGYLIYLDGWQIKEDYPWF